MIDLRTKVEDLEAAFKELDGAQDRPTAIVAAALVESVLEDGLVQRLRITSNTQRNALFEGEGGFAGFSAKINLGFALGLYGPRTKNDIDYIRKIRNEFAHYLGRSFAHPDITKWTALLSERREDKPDKTELNPIARALWSDRDNRWKFVFCAHAIVSGLYSEITIAHQPPAPTALD